MKEIFSTPWHLAAKAAFISWMVCGGLAVATSATAQEVEPPPKVGEGSIVAPSPWMTLISPVGSRVDLKVYGFYIGDIGAPSAQVDVGIRATKFLTITPSYLYYSVPASGLDDLVNVRGAFSESYDEHQFRIDGTATFNVGRFEIQGRNMYVRRFRPDPADDSNRYRGRIGVVRPVKVNGRTLRPYASYEAFYEYHNGGWNKDRVWTGVTVPVVKHVSFQPSYLWERTDGTKTINYVLFGVIVSTR